MYTCTWYRTLGEILALAGCDRLTIAPKFLDALSSSNDDVKLCLSPEISKYEGEKITLTEAGFRFLMNEDAMATEKLAEGIRNFSIDLRKLEDHIKGIMN